MLPILHIGPLAIQTPGLILLLGLWIGISLTERQAHHHAIPAGKIYNLILWSAAAGIVAARLSYIASHFSSFAESPGSIVSLNTALLDPWAGAAGAFLAALIYGHRSQLPFWNTLDALTHLLAVFAVASGLSHLASGDAYGAPADLPWSIWLWGAYRHPSQVYETGAALFILFALWPQKGFIRPQAPGVRFLTFIALTAAARLFLEAFRGDSTLLPGGLRLAQLAAWIVLAACLWGLRKWIK